MRAAIRTLSWARVRKLRMNSLQDMQEHLLSSFLTLSIKKARIIHLLLRGSSMVLKTTELVYKFI